MSPDTDRWRTRLSEYLDGDLPPGEGRALEEHLRGCEPCSRMLGELRTLRDRARGLGPLEPPVDLWPGIAARLSPGPVEPRAPAAVLALRPHDGRRRVALTLPQMAAAAAALVVFSAGITAAVLRDGAAPAEPASTASAALAEPGSDAAEARLRELRGVLDPETLRVLERNLRTIDRAVAESEAALGRDPDNAYLRAHLRRARAERRAYVDEAVRVAEWSG